MMFESKLEGVLSGVSKKNKRIAIFYSLLLLTPTSTYETGLFNIERTRYSRNQF